MQRRVEIWILGVFKTSPLFNVKAIVGFIPINLHLKKLSGRSQLQAYSLPSNHILCSFIEPREDLLYYQHLLSLGGLTRYQYNLIKSSLVNIDDWYNKVFSSFNPLYPELLSSNRVIDIFSDCFSFHPVSKYNSLKDQIQKLNNLAIELSGVSTQALVITDASIKNNVAISISHIYIYDKLIIKTLCHASNVISTKVKLFAIRCGINQVMNSKNISRIIVIIDSLHTRKKIFDLLLHPFQSYPTFVLNELQVFFSHSQENMIKFWECLSHSKWHLYNTVDKNTKSFNPILLLSCKHSWNFSKKLEYDDIVNRWKITFQVSDTKGKYFLNLVDSNDKPIELLYIKGGLWLKFFGHSNSLCVRVTEVITNHAPIGKYRLRFFLREDFSCSCRLYPIKSRYYILYECKRFNNYWNPRRDSISYFILFLEFNSDAFAFNNAFI